MDITSPGKKPLSAVPRPSVDKQPQPPFEHPIQRNVKALTFEIVKT
jgi:hypothetical protein